MSGFDFVKVRAQVTIGLDCGSFSIVCSHLCSCLHNKMRSSTFWQNTNLHCHRFFVCVFLTPRLTTCNVTEQEITHLLFVLKADCLTVVECLHLLPDVHPRCLPQLRPGVEEHWPLRSGAPSCSVSAPRLYKIQGR